MWALILVLPAVCAANLFGQSLSRAPVDPVRVLSHRLSHGIGDSPLDSPLLADPTDAAILLAARDGITPAELSRSFQEVPDLEVRLTALEKAGLLQRSSLVRTTFPIVIGERQVRYQRLVTATADRVYGQLLPHVRSLKVDLRAQGWGEWAYHFVWSQVFDSQVIWVEMIERKLAPPLSPMQAWVAYPQHPFKSGTNIYPDDELRDPLLAVTWTPNGANMIGLVGAQWRIIYAAAVEGAPKNPAARDLLSRWGLLDAKGHSRIPVVRRGSPIQLRLEEMARTYLALLQEHLTRTEFATLLGTDPKVAWAMAYHDVSWELLRRFVNRGELRRPAALVAQQQNAPEPAMVGVCTIVPAHPKFVAMIEAALTEKD